MKPAILRPGLSRLAAVALLAGLLALLWMGLGRPLLARRAAAVDGVAAAEAQLARFRAAIAEDGAPPAAAPEAALLPTEAPALAAAALQRRIDAAIARAGGERLAVEPRDPERLDGALQVSLVVDARFDAAGLLAFLHDVETGSPYVFVDGLEARRGRGALDAGPGSDAAAPERTEIAIRLTLSALMRPPPGDG